MSADAYTIRQVAEQIGRSVSWLRGQVRAGKLTPERVTGKHGEELRFTEADAAQARSLIPVPRTPAGSLSEAYAIATRAQDAYQRDTLALRGQVSDLRADVARLQAERDAEADNAARLLAERDAERERLDAEHKRVEALKALTWVDYLRGRHRAL
jgi:ABC-type phosphate transport system auxiliary subunit